MFNEKSGFVCVSVDQKHGRSTKVFNKKNNRSTGDVGLETDDES